MCRGERLPMCRLRRRARRARAAVRRRSSAPRRAARARGGGRPSRTRGSRHASAWGAGLARNRASRSPRSAGRTSRTARATRRRRSPGSRSYVPASARVAPTHARGRSRRSRDVFRVERLVVAGEVEEAERPEQRAERLATPDRVDHPRVVGRQQSDRPANVALQRASLVDGLGLRAKLGALHGPVPNGSTHGRSRLVSRRRARCPTPPRCRAPARGATLRRSPRRRSRGGAPRPARAVPS